MTGFEPASPWGETPESKSGAFTSFATRAPSKRRSKRLLISGRTVKFLLEGNPPSAAPFDSQSVAEKRAEEYKSHFDDLKERLSNSEMENQRLRGYIQRVQEDDVVREELGHVSLDTPTTNGGAVS